MVEHPSGEDLAPFWPLVATGFINIRRPSLEVGKTWSTGCERERGTTCQQSSRITRSGKDLAVQGQDLIKP